MGKLIDIKERLTEKERRDILNSLSDEDEQKVFESLVHAGQIIRYDFSKYSGIIDLIICFLAGIALGAIFIIAMNAISR